MRHDGIETTISTDYINNNLSRCEDVEELKEQILPMMKSQQEQWCKKMAEIISESGYTKVRFAELCDVSRVTLDKWLKGAIPRNRETFLKIGLVANYDREKMDHFLQRYGRYPALYSKSLEDCICIFVLNNNDGTDKIEKFKYILNKIKESIVRTEDGDSENISTQKFEQKLSDVQDEDELERFIAENSAIFTFAYHKLNAYINAVIKANYGAFASSLFEMAEAQGWSSSLRQHVSEIRQNKWYPMRNKIISLGLHLSMDREQIDDMLERAHMEPLCAKNIFESAIIFILEDASLNNVFDEESEEYNPDELCRYAKQILTELDLPEVEFFISELSEIDDEG